MKVKTIGMLGGGQLGRMAALAAARLGITVIPYDPNPDSPAFQVCEEHVCAPWDDQDALEEFADAVDVITYEFENVPLSTLTALMPSRDIWPSPELLQTAQHRIKEKTYLNSIGIPTTKFSAFEDPASLDQTLKQWGVDECILKTCRMGYDGKGQTKYKIGDSLPVFIDQDVIIEACVDFESEISVIVARDLSGTIKCYSPVLNEHSNHILAKSIAPAPIPTEIIEQARQYGEKLARATSLVGVLALELFLTKDGKLLANEIAPRPHNSGHWTIDACYCSQFEQQIRAVSGLPLGSTEAHSNAEMYNLLGDDILEIGDILNNPRACVHVYGKPEPRKGRKMGHITILKD